MTVIRVKIQDHFTTLYNGVLENPKLSFKAKGLWAYCMSRKEDWQFHISHLATVSKEGTDAVYSALKELIGAGMVERAQANESGRFGKVDYIIYPYPPELKKCLPQRDFPDAGFPHTENPALISTEEHKELRKEQSPIVPKGDLSPPRRKKEKVEKQKVALEVYLTPKQIESLRSKLNNDPDKEKACYEKLSEWKIKQQITGGNDYASMLKWVIGAVEKDAAKPKPQDRTAADEQLAKQIAIKYPSHPDITVGHNYIEFHMGRGNTQHIKFGDGGFKEQVENSLRKMGLTLSTAELSPTPAIPPRLNDQPKGVGLLEQAKNKRIQGHRMQALAWAGRKQITPGWEGTCHPMEDHVEFKTVSGLRKVYYHVSDELWAQETGWK